MPEHKPLIRLPSSLYKPALRVYFDWDDSGNNDYAARPLLIDLFAGGGGAAMGYYQAGFRLLGVDNRPQPHYPFGFIQMDAFEFLERYRAGEYEAAAAFHASPPCQYYTRLRHLPWLKNRVYWRSIPPTRAALQATGSPYVIENVEDARWDMPDSIVLCGQMFGFSLFRHRCFESWPALMLQPSHQTHAGILAPGRASLAKRHHGFGTTVNDWAGPAGHQGGIAEHKGNMGIDWMTGKELAQAIPPIMTRFVGAQLLAIVRGCQRRHA